LANSHNCVPASSCEAGCHPSYCTNKNAAPNCASDNFNCNYDDCHPEVCSCGWCPNTGPDATGTPLPTMEVSDTPTSTPTNTSTPTPTPLPGTIKARSVIVPSTNVTCPDILASPNYPSDSMTLSPDIAPGTQPVSGGSWATWSAPPGTYSVIAGGTPGYVLRMACWENSSGSSGSTFTADIGSSETLSWTLGYTLPGPWFQAVGGDVYATIDMRSYIPDSAVPRYFVLDGPGKTPGVVTYGSAYDFDSRATEHGEDYISNPSAKWLAHETYASTNYYQVFYHRFGSPTTTDYPGDTSHADQPASRATPYYVNGDLTIDANDWSVGSGQNVSVLVNGNLTIKKKINITGNGFTAFIVNGDITIDQSVGVSYSSESPVLEGVYITSPSGTFLTGDSSVANAER